MVLLDLKMTNSSDKYLLFFFLFSKFISICINSSSFFVSKITKRIRAIRNSQFSFLAQFIYKKANKIQNIGD